MKYAFLQYSFIFDPSTTWAHVYQFEKDLSDYFTACGYEAELMQQIEGAQQPKVFILKRIENNVVPTPNQPGRPLTIQGKVNQLRTVKTNAVVRDYKKGTFLPRKGYLKRG